MARWGQTSFRGGLNTDNRYADNSLRLCKDMILSADGELVKRGVLTNIATVANAASTSLNAFLLADTADNGGHLVSADSGGTDTMHAADISSSTYTSLGTSFVWDNGATAFTTQTFASSLGVSASSSWAQGNEELYFQAGTAIIRWGGGKKSTYATGTCSASSGSATVTGSGVDWTSTNVDVGMYFIPPTADEPYRIIARTTSTLTLDRNIQTTISGGSSYKIQNFAPVCVPTDITLMSTHDSLQNGYIGSSLQKFCFHQGRLFTAMTLESSSSYPNYQRVRWSATDTESHASISWAKGVDYWTDNAFLDLPSFGGRVTRMLSLSNTELLIVKNGAMFILRGSVATDGTDLGADLVPLSPNRGGIDAALTRIGTVVLSEDDVMVVDGGVVRSLIDGVIRTEFESGTWTRISSAGDLIVISGSAQNTSLVFDIPTSTWTTFVTEANPGRITELSNTSGSSRVYYAPMGGEIQSWSGMKTWDTPADDSDERQATYPVPTIRTQPIPLTSGNSFQGRMNTLYIDYLLTDSASNNPTITVKVITGRSGTPSSTTLEYTLSENTYDGQVARIPVSSALDATHCVVELSLTTADTAQDFAVYGIWVDYEESNRYG